jgi:hypothetical protein
VISIPSSRRGRRATSHVRWRFGGCERPASGSLSTHDVRRAAERDPVPAGSPGDRPGGSAVLGLSYPLAWMPAAIVVAVLVLLSSYLALLALLLVACLVLAAVAALVWAGITELAALFNRGWHAWSGAAEPDDVPSESRRETAHS